jgi:phosphatidylserine/phosphatidylglycerophosphate/cardiolipin synthase-like enzyme
VKVRRNTNGINDEFSLSCRGNFRPFFGWSCLVSAGIIASFEFRRMKRLILLLAIVANTAMAATALPAGASYDIGFSPGGTSLNVVLQGINSAKTDILVAAYGFSSKPIAQALLAASRRGVHVAVVADQKANSRGYSAVTFLANQGVPVRLNGRYAIHHHKFMVIDGRHLETGSFNFTQAAVKSNAENVILLWNVPNAAATYAREWRRLWDEATPLPPSH